MKKSLIIIDVQNDYFEQGKMELYQPQKALEKILKLREHFRQQQLPVFYIQHVNIRKNATFFLPESHGVALHPQLLPLASQNEFIILKNHPNSFWQTDLHQQLQQQSIQQLVICGMMTHMCIDSTTRCAAELGYHPILIADGCTTRDQDFNSTLTKASDVQNSFLAALTAFAKVQSAEQFIH
ncbi:cysteine hydrolase family protein [Snodgrassella communis]|uniref:cysteine hydrolase family protein n=1 Tax=Snodgrassella communis TaxID=2946699 RepID=UPI000565398F|nr:cysteine hydrolase family protein [Snodgrassella communis]